MAILTGTAILPNGLPAEGLAISFSKPQIGANATAVQAPVVVDSSGSFSAEAIEAEAARDLIATITVNGEQKTLRPIRSETDDSLIFVVPPDAAKPKPEFERVSESVKTVIGADLALGDLTEADDRQDLTLLTRATDWDARVLALASLADRAVTKETVSGNKLGISTEAAYAAMRAGLPTDAATLATVHPDTFEQALKAADDASVVALGEAMRKQEVEQFKTFRIAELSKAKPGAGASAFDDLLELVPKGETLADGRSEREAFAELVYRSWDYELGSTIWGKAKEAGVSEKTIEALKLQGYLAYLTLNNAPLIKAVKGKFNTLDTFADDLLNNEFDKPATWATAIEALGDDPPLPDAFKQAEDPTKAYTEEISRRIKLSFPTQLVAALVERGEVTPHDEADINDKTAELLKKAAKAGFRFGERTPQEFFANNANLAPADDETGEKIMEALTTLHRLYQITPSNEMLALLSEFGIRSAQEVAQFPFEEFLTVMSTRTSSRAEVELVHKRAREISSYVYTFFSIARQSFGAPAGVQAASAPNHVRTAALDSLRGALPSMESLFGSLDYAQTDHARSVLGPAAYLVDILRFLDPDDKVWEGFTENWSRLNNGQEYPFEKPFDELRHRRPDIVHLQLTRENTETELPTIDLVNEILEYRLLLDPENPKHHPDGGVRDSGATESADVLAEPEFVREEVYDKLLPAALHPLPLPFDLWHATMREFAQWLDLPLWHLQRTLEESVDPAADAAALIGAAPTEFALVGDPAKASVKARYGLADAADLKDLANAKALARRLHISYLDLADLLESRFVNPGLDAFTWPLAAGISVASAREWRTEHNLASNAEPANQEILPLWRRMVACKSRLSALDAAHGMNPDDADKKLRALPDEAFANVVLLHNDGDRNDFSQTELVTGAGGAIPAKKLEELLLRIDMFTRLRRRLGWSTEELDALLAGTAANLTTESLATALARIALVRELESLLPDAGRPDLVALVAGVSTQGLNPSYRRLFLSRPAAYRDPAFDAAFGDYLANDERVGDHLPALQSAIGLTAKQIAAVLGTDRWEDEKLTVNLVERLHRHAVLARALNIDAIELATLQTLSGIDPADNAALVRATQHLTTAALSVSETEALVGTATAGPDGSVVRPDVPEAVLEACRAAAEARADAERAEEVADLDAAARAAIIESAGASAPLASALLLGEAWPTAAKPLLERYLSVDPAQVEVSVAAQVETSATAAHSLLAKTGFLASKLSLTEAEVRALELAEWLDAGSDPADVAAQAAKAAARFAKLQQALDYHRLRRTAASGSSDLIDVVSGATDGPTDAAERLALVTTRTPAELRAAAEEVGVALTNTFSVPDLVRVWVVASLASKVGVAPATLRKWADAATSDKPIDRRNAAKQIKDAARAHLGGRWNQVAAPISDRLRQQQRDALVALSLERTGLESLEQLFEEILIDPGSEPVLRTSRIRQAISAVQLFVQRVLLNLEPKVHPTSIKAAQWEWMKRYRMWEANRKIFLFPENWLEPEFRDDKSFMFSQLESTLLQSDVTNDTAEDALLAYLKQLDEVARLDIVTAYLEQDYLDPSLNTLHVIGRTFAHPRRYFYRRLSHGIWSPWEPVELDITGDRVILTHWRDRLYLFWVTTLIEVQEPKPDEKANPPTGELTTVKIESLRAAAGPPKRVVKVQLHWSEYVNRAWAESKSSEFEYGGSISAGGGVSFVLHAEVTGDDALRIHLNGTPTMVFTLEGRNSPLKTGGTVQSRNNGLYKSGSRAALGVEFNPVLSTVNGRAAEAGLQRSTVLAAAGRNLSLLQPSNELSLVGDIGPLVSPFFLKDGRRTLFAQPTLREDTIEESVESWTLVQTAPPLGQHEIPWEQFVLVPQAPRKPAWHLPEPLITKWVMPRDQLLNPATVVAFDERLVAPKEAIALDRVVITGLPGARGVAEDARIRVGDISEVIVGPAGGSIAASDFTAVEHGIVSVREVAVLDHSTLSGAGLAASTAIKVQGSSGLFGRTFVSSHLGIRQ